MFQCENISSRVARVDDHHGNGPIISHGFDGVEVDLPVPMGQEVELADLQPHELGACFVQRKHGPGEEDVGPGASQNREQELDRLARPRGYEHVILGQLVWKISTQMICNSPGIYINQYKCDNKFE